MKNKLIGTLLIVVMFASNFGLTLSATFSANEVQVTIDGVPVFFPDASPAIIDGRTLVPIRAVFEALNFDVFWNPATGTAVLTNNSNEITISVGAAVFQANGVNHTLDVPAQIVGGSTLMPIRLPLESVGFRMEWNNSTRTVMIFTGEPTAELPPAGGQNVQQTPPVTVNRSPVEQEIFDLLNAERQRAGLNPFTWNNYMASSARRILARDVDTFSDEHIWIGLISPDGSFAYIGAPPEVFSPSFIINEFFTDPRLSQQRDTFLNPNNTIVSVASYYDHILIAYASPENMPGEADPLHKGHLHAAGLSIEEIKDIFEREVFRLTNIERANYGLPPLIWHDTLRAAARVHSVDMSENFMISHTGTDGSDVGQRIERQGLVVAGWSENLAIHSNSFSPQAVVQGWMDSPGHRVNILRPESTHLGVGIHFMIENGVPRFGSYTQKFAVIR